MHNKQGSRKAVSRAPYIVPSRTSQTSVDNADNTLSNGLIARAKISPHNLLPADVLRLQRSIGNRAVAKLLQHQVPASSRPTLTVQPKLTVGPAGDAFEIEADRIADQVVRSPAPTQRKYSEENEAIQRVQTIQRIQRNALVGLEGGTLDTTVESSLRRAQNGGSSMPNSVRKTLEPKLGADLGRVKVHTDTRAAQLSRDMGAKAFTHKNHIYYGAGESPSNLKLTAHETVHTIQQGAVSQAPVQRDVQRTHKQNHFGTVDGQINAPAIQRAKEKTTSNSDGEVTAPLEEERQPFSLKGTLSGRAKFKGFFGKKSTFAKLQAELANYRNADGPAEELASLTILNDLAKQWLVGHAKDKKKDLVKETSITKLLEDISREMPLVNQRILDDVAEQDEYIRQIEAKSLKYMSQSGHHIAKRMKGWHSGEDKMGNQATAVHELTQKHGLTLAEATAIGIYTADDYKYINPAAANNRGWMKAMLPRVGFSNSTTLSSVHSGLTDTHVDDAMQEGQLHGKIAKAGMKKLPNFVGSVYRGLGLTEEQFAAQYPIGGTTVFPAFSSTSLKESVSKGFARNESTGDKIGVLLELRTTRGKDIATLSNAPGEAEILLMPGATLELQRLSKKITRVRSCIR